MPFRQYLKIAFVALLLAAALVDALYFPHLKAIASDIMGAILPTTSTDIATPANPGSGTTKVYTKSGTACSLSPAGIELCTGAIASGGTIVKSGLSALNDPAITGGNAANDEFDAGSLGGNWSVITNNATTVSFSSVWSGYLYVKNIGAQAYTISQSFAPGGDFSALIHFSTAFSTASCCGLGIQFCESSDCTGGAGVDGLQGRVAITAGGQMAMDMATMTNGVWTYNVNTATFNNDMTTGYLYLDRSGNNWRVCYSQNGLAFRCTAVTSKTFTVATMRLDLGQSSDTALYGVDWLRFNWITL